MDFEVFETWLERLSAADRIYLQQHPTWNKEYAKAKQGRSLTKGFAEKTMELLEGGSESET